MKENWLFHNGKGASQLNLYQAKFIYISKDKDYFVMLSVVYNVHSC